MKLKKTNAVLVLLSALTLLIHIGYNTFAHLTFQEGLIKQQDCV